MGANAVDYGIIEELPKYNALKLKETTGSRAERS